MHQIIDDFKMFIQNGSISLDMSNWIVTYHKNSCCCFPKHLKGQQNLTLQILINKMAIKIEEKPFGKLKDGSEVKLYRLSNQNGMFVEVNQF